jgi:hypothetical protein
MKTSGRDGAGKHHGVMLVRLDQYLLLRRPLALEARITRPAITKEQTAMIKISMA